MTLTQPGKDSRDRDNSGSDLQKSTEGFLSSEVLSNADKITGKKFSEPELDRSLYGKSKACMDLETDQESIGSCEEMESPRSVAKVGQWTAKRIAYMHSQILRIREEDSHIGEDIDEYLSAKDKLAGHHVTSHMDVILVSRSILPASPLSDKTAIKTV
ncbi:hypothetical protein F0562_005058 [Nyssa sinensis]|uniref:Uncharacterized protein n=1 Tax=Nyssa sinensis TaxID=561372 RepID=A0A5J5AJP0_9ASTE|nr:hypothetical protein F0562_005058 [Nyssa sinensis]